MLTKPEPSKRGEVDAFMVGILLGIVLMLGVFVALGCHSPLLNQDDQGIVRFRNRWSTPPSCVIDATESELRYYCIGE